MRRHWIESMRSIRLMKQSLSTYPGRSGGTGWPRRPSRPNGSDGRAGWTAVRRPSPPIRPADAGMADGRTGVRLTDDPADAVMTTGDCATTGGRATAGDRMTGGAADDGACAGLTELAEASLGEGDGFTDWPLVTMGAGLWLETPVAPSPPHTTGHDGLRAVCSA